MLRFSSYHQKCSLVSHLDTWGSILNAWTPFISLHLQRNTHGSQVSSLPKTRVCCTRWFKYDRDYLCVNKSQFFPVIFEPPCIFCQVCLVGRWMGLVFLLLWSWVRGTLPVSWIMTLTNVSRCETFEPQKIRILHSRRRKCCFFM